MARIVLLAALALSLPGSARAGSPPASVDARVWQDTGAGGRARFLVVLKDQAALDHLPQAKPARGAALVARMRAAARGSQPALTRLLDRQGVAYRPYWIVNLLVVEGDARLVALLAARPEVASIQPDREFTLEADPTAGVAMAVENAQVEWNIARIGAPQLWAQGIDGTGLVFASADTGVQWDHPALINAYRGWNGVAADHNTNWWDAIHEAGGDLPAPYDDNGHGTHTTGIAVGSPVEHAIGVAPGAKWIACRNMLNGVGTPSRYIECLQFFLAPTDLAGNNPDPAKAPDVINNSYACPTYEGCAVRALQAAVEAVREAGIFFAVSAGNDGYLGCGTIDEPPAIEPAGFTVGATGYDDRIAPFSSRGPVSVDGLSWRKPEISAPGMSVNTGGIFSSVNNSSYDYKRGTSMASPHVAGAVLLLWQAEPALRGQVGASESLLELSALHLPPPENEPLCGDDTASRIPNNVYGWGRLDVANAVLLAGLDQFAYFPFVSR